MGISGNFFCRKIILAPVKKTIERALGIKVDPAVRLLRRLFYCGEWIESHALHIYMLHAPDFLGYQPPYSARIGAGQLAGSR